MKTQRSKNVGMQQKQFKREVYSNTILPQETRKTLNRQPNFTPKMTGKRIRREKKNEISRRKEIKISDLSRDKRKRNERNNSKD